MRRLQRKNSCKEEITNALIMAGLTFFQTLIGVSVAQLLDEPGKCLIASVVAACFAFFSILAILRGLGK